ncbi:MerR family transcriptional regulator [Yinghuangia seranimata]|uniref:MerR family transcriptional regulator n=1 Tax=Yinghuangia seranimata TaxID=408067 RepID=UPI00248CF209|nr:MerR family transcriptional regulator [Yinghuangia seranimata]MDI2131087.1 MerR family transcriptional regulator [Yinghuangia seranimata]
MDGSRLYSIGELAQRTGLTVKTIRFYSDRGVVTPAGRTAAGYRCYGADAVARLALVRTLRELGLGLDDIRRVADRELTLGEVAAEHAAALDVQMRVLRLRKAVLTAAARREPTFEEMERMHRLAMLSEAERRRLTEAFLADVFDGHRDDPRHAAPQRSMTPELPDDPTPEQVEAWVELAELSLDPGFRAALRSLVDDHTAHHPADGSTPPRPDPVAMVRDTVAAAVASGMSPDAPEADPVVAAFTARCAATTHRPDDADLRTWLLERLEPASDPRKDRYCTLLATVNGWPPPEPLAPAIVWTVRALKARTPVTGPPRRTDRRPAPEDPRLA